MLVKIYQMKQEESTRGRKFQDLPEDKEVVSMGDYYLMHQTYRKSGEIDGILDSIYAEYNMQHPNDFYGHSVSVSDIIQIDSDYYYVQGMGFKKVTVTHNAEDRRLLGFPGSYREKQIKKLGNKISGEVLAEFSSQFVNSYNLNSKEFCETMGNQHRTLQQSFTRLCVEWFKYLSTTQSYDGRNEASVNLAKEIMQKCNTYLPLV